MVMCEKCKDNIYDYIIRNFELVGNTMIYNLYYIQNEINTGLVRMGMAWRYALVEHSTYSGKRNLTLSDHRRR